MKIADIDYSLQAGDVFIWQYANALRLNQILQNEINYYGENISQFITDWETDVLIFWLQIHLGWICGENIERSKTIGFSSKLYYRHRNNFTLVQS